MPKGTKTTRAGMNRRRFVALTGAGVGTSALAGCIGPFGSGGSDDELVIGGLQPYTGPFTEVAQEFEAGFEFVLDQVNDDGGLLDKNVVFETRDTETNASDAMTIGTRLIQREGAIALTGPVSSDVGIQAGNLAEDEEVPIVFNQVGSHAAIDRDSQYTYRLGLLPAPTTAEATGQFLEEQDVDVVRAIIADYAYGRAFETAIDEVFPDDIDIDTAVAPMDEDDFTPYLRDMPDELDVLIATSHPAGATNIFQQLGELDLDPEYVLGNSEDMSIWNVLGESATDGWLSIHQPYLYSEEYETVAREFHDETEEYFGLLASLGYVAAELITTAIENADEEDPVAISDEIRAIELDTLFSEPIQYTEWGELQGKRQVFSGFAEGAPEHYPDGDFHLEEEFVTEPLDGFDPDEFEE